MKDPSDEVGPNQPRDPRLTHELYRNQHDTRPPQPLLNGRASHPANARPTSKSTDPPINTDAQDPRTRQRSQAPAGRGREVHKSNAGNIRHRPLPKDQQSEMKATMPSNKTSEDATTGCFGWLGRKCGLYSAKKKKEPAPSSAAEEVEKNDQGSEREREARLKKCSQDHGDAIRETIEALEDRVARERYIMETIDNFQQILNDKQELEKKIQLIEAANQAGFKIVEVKNEQEKLKRQREDESGQPEAKKAKIEYVTKDSMPPSLNVFGTEYVNIDNSKPVSTITPELLTFSKKVVQKQHASIKNKIRPDLSTDRFVNVKNARRGCWIWVPDMHSNSNINSSDDYSALAWMGGAEAKLRPMYVLSVDGDNITGVLCYTFSGKGPVFKSKIERDGYVPLHAKEDCKKVRENAQWVPFNVILSEGFDVREGAVLSLAHHKINLRDHMAPTEGTIFKPSLEVLEKLIEERQKIKKELNRYDNGISQGRITQNSVGMDACEAKRREERVFLRKTDPHCGTWIPNSDIGMSSGALKVGKTTAMAQLAVDVDAAGEKMKKDRSDDDDYFNRLMNSRGPYLQ